MSADEVYIILYRQSLLFQLQFLKATHTYMTVSIEGKAGLPPREEPRVVSSRKRRGTALLTAGAIFTTCAVPYTIFHDTLTQLASNVTDIRTERQPQPDQGFVHNGHIGIEPSMYLPGVIDLKRLDKESETWKTYNVIVPDVVANGISTNAEIFGTRVHMEHTTSQNGDIDFAIQFEKMHGFRLIDEHHAYGNGAHFKIRGTIPAGKAEITTWIEPNEDSAPIEKASIANFFGAAEAVNTFVINETDEHHVSMYPKPNDGNFELGDFYTLPLSNARGTLSFWNDRYNLVQYQRYTAAEVLNFEIRSHQWRPEYGNAEQDPWIETLRIWQPLDGEHRPTWTFGYETVGSV